MVESTEPNSLPDLARNNLCTHLNFFICEVDRSSCWPAEGWWWLWQISAVDTVQKQYLVCAL